MCLDDDEELRDLVHRLHVSSRLTTEQLLMMESMENGRAKQEQMNNKLAYEVCILFYHFRCVKCSINLGRNIFNVFFFTIHYVHYIIAWYYKYRYNYYIINATINSSFS